MYGKYQIILNAIVVVFFLKFFTFTISQHTLLHSCLPENCWSYILVRWDRMNKKTEALTLMSSLPHVADQFCTSSPFLAKFWLSFIDLKINYSPRESIPLMQVKLIRQQPIDRRKISSLQKLHKWRGSSCSKLHLTTILSPGRWVSWILHV